MMRVPEMMNPTVEARFWAKVTKLGSNACWLWTGAANAKGYGYMRFSDEKNIKATHVSLLIAGVARPESSMCLHSCDNPRCVNPAHLRWGTARENNMDAVQRCRVGGFAIPGRKLVGDDHSGAKLTEGQIRQIRQSSMTHKNLAQIYGVCRSNIGLIKSGKTWGHVL